MEGGKGEQGKGYEWGTRCTRRKAVKVMRQGRLGKSCLPDQVNLCARFQTCLTPSSVFIHSALYFFRLSGLRISSRRWTKTVRRNSQVCTITWMTQLLCSLTASYSIICTISSLFDDKHLAIEEAHGSVLARRPQHSHGFDNLQWAVPSTH
jgi:hypothetical protein